MSKITKGTTHRIPQAIANGALNGTPPVPTAIYISIFVQCYISLAPQMVRYKPIFLLLAEGRKARIKPPQAGLGT